MAPITFRPLATADLPMLGDWLARPHVAEWWDGIPTPDELREEYAPLIAGSAVVQVYIAHDDTGPIGYIQSYVPALCHDDGWWLEEHDPGVRGIDQFLADGDRLGQGLGTRMIGAFVARLFEDASVTRIQTDPSPANARAVRCYTRVGFRPEREVDTPDGRALLMYLDRHVKPHDERAPARAITGFHPDAEGHWVADLACGHAQHVRHEPPLQSRPWVLTEEGRQARLGETLPCMRCLTGEPAVSR